jgi:hypothetical protein
MKMIEIDWKIIEETMNLRHDILLVQYLQMLKVKIIEMRDDKGYSLLHYAVLNLKADTIHTLVRFARDH